MVVVDQLKDINKYELLRNNLSILMKWLPRNRQQQEEEEYRNYTPKDFDKLSPDQLEEAYQKGQQSLESIQSYLASVSQKRNEKMKICW